MRMQREKKQACQGLNEQGFALLGVFLVILMMTVLGVASLTVTGMGNQLAGSAYSDDAGLAAAESCVGTSANVLLQTIEQRQVPGVYVGAAALVPLAAEVGAPPTLTQEIMGQADNNPDFPIGAGASPDIQMTSGPFVIAGDIDRLYLKQKAGGSLQFAAGYEGAAQSAASGGTEVFYQIDCTATLAATGTMSRIRAVYACTGMAGDSCQRRI